MNFEEAKMALRDGYIKAGLQLVDEHREELVFTFAGLHRNIYISEQEIKEYADFDIMRSTFKAIPVECSICSPDYREQVVDYFEQDRRRIFGLRDIVFTFGSKDNDEVYAEISPASTTFINVFRFDEAFLQIFMERVDRNTILLKTRESKKNAIDIQELLPRVLTIKVYNLQKTSAEAALETSMPIVDACLFALSYLKNITLNLEEEWPRRLPRVKPFRYGEPIAGTQLPLKRALFNPDIIRFYQRGMCGADPVNQFLSYYQVLEYFFVSVSDEQLYNKLACRITDPKLTATPSYLDRIIQDVVEHKGVTDETEMLKQTLNKFVDEADLIEFINTYETYLNDNIYTKKRTIFGTELETKLIAGHLNGNVAKRIKTIRNAIVHSSDRYERSERYIPSVNAEKFIDAKYHC